MSAINFYPDCWIDLYCWPHIVHTYKEAQEYLEERRNLDTTQMCLLTDHRVKEYDIIRIITYNKFLDLTDSVEILNNRDGTYDCGRTERTLRRENNFFKMWENGVFDD